MSDITCHFIKCLSTFAQQFLIDKKCIVFILKIFVLAEENIYSTTAMTLQCAGRQNKTLASKKEGEVNHTMTYSNPEEIDNKERNEYVPPDNTCNQEENQVETDDYLTPVVKCDLILKVNSIGKVASKSKEDNVRIHENKGQVNEYILPDLATYYTITEAVETKTDEQTDQILPEKNIKREVIKTVSSISETSQNKVSCDAYGNLTEDNQMQVVDL